MAVAISLRNTARAADDLVQSLHNVADSTMQAASKNGQYSMDELGEKLVKNLDLYSYGPPKLYYKPATSPEVISRVASMEEGALQLLVIGQETVLKRNQQERFFESSRIRNFYSRHRCARENSKASPAKKKDAETDTASTSTGTSLLELRNFL
ncbi:unnamed protein product [Amoebophrya sp. A120]|nr:unnamed protein product [Amoebophrya sp. A120]|eukprot:GSA120T00023634001.1